MPEPGLVRDEHRRRLGRHRRDEDDARVLEAMNEALAAVQDYPPPGPPRPSLWIFGLPRSGTTLLYQVLAWCLEVGYVDNVAARFWGAPCVGAAVSRSVLAGRRDGSFTSEYGRTRDPAGPHEFGYFWQRALGVRCLDDTLRFAGDDGDVDWERIRRIVHALQDAWNAPMLSKTNYVANYLSAFARHMPMPLFVHVERDPVHVGLSILKARREYYGDESAWWATCPPEYHDLAGRPAAEQIAGQVRGLRRAYREAIARVPAELVLEVPYADLCADPDGVVARVRERVGERHGVDVGVRARIGEPFRRRAPAARDDPAMRAVAAALGAGEECA